MIDFIYIGPGRSGSTFLYRFLAAHPGISLPTVKELNFFNSNYHLGRTWYENQFTKSGALKHGEVSNTYIYDSRTAARIKGEYPNVKVLSIFRNPYHFVRSVYEFRLQAGEINHAMQFGDALQKYPDILNRTDYYELALPFVEAFGANYQILFFDDLVNDPERFVGKVGSFLEIEELSNFKFEKINEARTIRHPILAQLKRRSADWLRQKKVFWLLQALKNSEALHSFLHKQEKDAREIDLSLVDRFAPVSDRIRKFESLVNRDLKDWHLSGKSENSV